MWGNILHFFLQKLKKICISRVLGFFFFSGLLSPIGAIVARGVKGIGPRYVTSKGLKTAEGGFSAGGREGSKMDQGGVWGDFDRFLNFRPPKFFLRPRKKISTGPPQKSVALNRPPIGGSYFPKN